MKTTIVAIGILAIALGSAGAQSAPATITTAAHLRALGDSLTPGASRTGQLGKGPNLTYALTHRDSAGGVEAHRDWTDVLVIQTGSATLFSGGALQGATERSPGEWRGGTIVGGTKPALHSGDLAITPAATPHQIILGRASMRRTAFKVAARSGSGILCRVWRHAQEPDMFPLP